MSEVCGEMQQCTLSYGVYMQHNGLIFRRVSMQDLEIGMNDVVTWNS